MQFQIGFGFITEPSCPRLQNYAMSIVCMIQEETDLLTNLRAETCKPHARAEDRNAYLMKMSSQGLDQTQSQNVVQKANALTPYLMASLTYKEKV
jgi:hypothetical protein